MQLLLDLLFLEVPWGDGVGGAIRKEDTDILEMWNKVIAEMSSRWLTTAEITKNMVWSRYVYVINFFIDYDKKRL